MKIVIPTPLKKGLLLVLLGMGMQSSFVECMNRQQTPEEEMQLIQNLVSDKELLKQTLLQWGIQDPRLTELTEFFFNKPQQFKLWIDKINAQQQPQRKTSPKKTVVKKKKLTDTEVVSEFNKIVQFSKDPQNFSHFLKKESGDVFIGYLSNDAIAARTQELEQRFALYRILKPAAFGFGALAVVMGAWSVLKTYQLFFNGARGVGSAPKAHKSELLTRIALLEERQKLLPTGALSAQSSPGILRSWFNGAAGLMSFGAITLVRCAFSDIGMQVLSSWGLTPASWLMRNYPFGELFSSIPSLTWMMTNQSEILNDIELVHNIFTDNRPKTFLEKIKTFFEDEEESEYERKPKHGCGFLSRFDNVFEKSKEKNLNINEKRRLVETFERFKDMYCNKNYGMIVELASNVGLFMRDIEKILGYIKCRMSQTSPTSKAFKRFGSAYTTLYRLANELVHGLRKGEYEQAFESFIKVREHLVLCREIFR